VRPQRSRRGLSGIWSGVLVILILLLTSSFIFIALNYIDQATKTAINTVKKAGESCSISRSIAAFWTYNATSSELIIHITNYYYESITIISLGLLINDTGRIYHLIIDKYNSLNYGISLPYTISPGSNIKLTIQNIVSNPIIVTIGIWGSGLVSISIPPYGLTEGTNTLMIPKENITGLLLEPYKNYSKYFIDFNNIDKIKNNWTKIGGEWKTRKNKGYWGQGDGAINGKLKKHEKKAFYMLKYNFESYNKLYVSTKILFKKINKHSYAGVYFYVNNKTDQGNFSVMVSKNTLGIYYFASNGSLKIKNITNIKINKNKWYSLIIYYAINDNYINITVWLYDDKDDKLLAILTSRSATISPPRHLGLVIYRDNNKKIEVFYDEFLVSQADPRYITFIGTYQGWQLDIIYESFLINSSTSLGSSTKIGVIDDPVTGVGGNSTVCVNTFNVYKCVTPDFEILGGNIYEIILVSGGNVTLRNIVSVSSSSR